MWPKADVFYVLQLVFSIFQRVSFLKQLSDKQIATIHIKSGIGVDPKC